MTRSVVAIGGTVEDSVKVSQLHVLNDLISRSRQYLTRIISC